MLKLTFSVHMKLRVKAKCPRHPRYNPEQGEGLIRGACPHCRALFAIVAARDEAYAALRNFETLAQPYLQVRASPSSPKS
jgi:hypothetical protein